MNAPKRKSTVRRVKPKRSAESSELTRLRRELKEVKRERDGYRHAIMTRFQEEAKNLDLPALYEQYCTGPEVDFVARLAEKYGVKLTGKTRS